MDIEKTRQTRRGKKELDETLWSALERLIIEQGFNNITFYQLAQEANVNPPVIYNRFEDVEELLERYVRKCDYWLNDIFKVNKELTCRENLKELLENLVNELYDNDIMQRIMLWELNDTHRITRLMSQSREVENSELIQYFSNKLENFEGISSLLISGIYFLILHRKVSTFSNVNYNTLQGKKIMIDTVKDMVDKLYPENNSQVDRKINSIAKKLLEKGVDKNIIKESTGLSIKEINNLAI